MVRDTHSDTWYTKMADYLITKNRFKKILFPNRRFSSSIYKKLGSEFFDYLEDLKPYIAKNNKENKKGS